MNYALAQNRVPDSLFDRGEIPLKLTDGTQVMFDRSGRFYDLGGRKIEMEVVGADVHDPTELPNALFGYRNAEFRADDLSQVEMADHLQDKYRVMDPKTTFQRVDVKASENAYPREIDYVSSLTPYNMDIRYVGSFVGGLTEQNASTGTALVPRAAAAQRCADAIQLDREFDVITLLTTTGSWDSSVVNTLPAGFQWNNGVNSDPVKDLRTAVTTSLMPIKFFAMSPTIAGYLIDNPSVRNMMRQIIGDAGVDQKIRDIGNPDAWGAGGAVLDFQIPGLPPIKVVATRSYDEATDTYPFLMSDFVIGIHSTPGLVANGRDIPTSTTFRLKGVGGTGWETREWRIEGRGMRGGVMVAVAQADIAKMTATRVGALIVNTEQ